MQKMWKVKKAQKDYFKVLIPSKAHETPFQFADSVEHV